jgi:hypothetical protein
MATRQPLYCQEEHARRGAELYERILREKVEAEHHGRIVAIDIETGDYEIADESLTAAQALLARRPSAQIWCVRVGYPYVHRFGPRAMTGRA